MKKFVLIFLTATCFSLKAEVKSYDIHGELIGKWQTTRVKEKTSHKFETEGTLGISYLFPQIWAEMSLKGYASEDETYVDLDTAWVGSECYRDDEMIINLEVGRHLMDSFFDSKVQYNSRFTGLHATYKFSVPGEIDFVLHGGPLLVEAVDDELAWVAEAIWSNLGSIPLTFKYSFINWNHEKYAISQVSASYIYKSINAYAAYIRNHSQSDYADGFYVGGKYGKLEKAHDWSADMYYTYLKSHAVPLFDYTNSGKGIHLKAGYAISDKMSAKLKLSLLNYKDKNAEFSVIYKW